MHEGLTVLYVRQVMEYMQRRDLWFQIHEGADAAQFKWHLRCVLRSSNNKTRFVLNFTMFFIWPGVCSLFEVWNSILSWQVSFKTNSSATTSRITFGILVFANADARDMTSSLNCSSFCGIYHWTETGCDKAKTLGCNVVKNHCSIYCFLSYHIGHLFAGRGRGVAVHIARGLVYLHSNNIVHLDLKSQVCPKPLP